MRREPADLALDVSGDVFAFAAKLEQSFDIGAERCNLRVLIDLLFQALAVLHHFLAFFRLSPEVGSVGLFF